MKHFFLINKVFPDISLEIKFELEEILNIIKDEQLNYRILKAIYLLNIDLEKETFDIIKIINDFIWIMTFTLKLYKESSRFEYQDETHFFATSVLLDVFFLLEFPQNIQFLEMIKSNYKDLNLKNFQLLKFLVNELYINSRESSLKLKKSFFSENISLENKVNLFKQTRENEHQFDEIISISEEFLDNSNCINQLLEYKNSLKIGIPSFLDFDFESKKEKRINFFYLEEENPMIVFKCVIFSLNLRNGTLEVLLKSLFLFQSMYQYNPMSILILRLIICRYSDKNQFLLPLEQLMNIGDSIDSLNSLFECSLLFRDKELFAIFDFYHYLELPTDFYDFILAFKNLAYLNMEKDTFYREKLSPWISTQLDYVNCHYKKLLKLRFPSIDQMTSYYLDYFKSEICLTSLKFENLISNIKNKNVIKEKKLVFICEAIQKLVYSIPFIQRNQILEILDILFSFSIENESEIKNSDLNNLILADYMIHDFFVKNLFSIQKNRESLQDFIETCPNLLYNKESDFNLSDLKKECEKLREQALMEFWTRSLMFLTRTKENKTFLKELTQILQIVSKKQLLSFWWFLTTHNRIDAANRISKLYSERRRIGSLQCGIYCIELELNNQLQQITKLLNQRIDCELKSAILFLVRHAFTQNLKDKFFCFLDISKKKKSICEIIVKIVHIFKLEFKRTGQIQKYGRSLHEINKIISDELVVL